MKTTALRKMSLGVACMSGCIALFAFAACCLETVHMLGVVDGWQEVEGKRVAEPRAKMEGNHVILDLGDVNVVAYPIGGPSHAEVSYNGGLWVENKSPDPVAVTMGALVLEGDPPRGAADSSGTQARLRKGNALIHMVEKGPTPEINSITFHSETITSDGPRTFTVLPGEEGDIHVTYTGAHSKAATWTVGISRKGVETSCKFSFQND